MLVLIFCKNYKKILLTSFFAGLAFVFLFNALPAKADFSACGITPTMPLWQAKASDGTVVMAVDSVGNLDIAATTVQTNTAPPASGLTSSFIIKNSTANKFAFNKTNAYITGAVLENQASLPAASGDDLVVNNSSGVAVALFDATTGNIYIKGSACALDMPGINSCVELQKIGNDPAYPLNGSYILTNNIDCRATNPGDPANDGSIWDKDGSIYGTGGTGFKPIGLFSGIFDGKGYQIQNLYMSYKAAIYYDTFAGLFGEANGAEIKEISLTNISITASRFTINQYCYAGGLVGRSNNTVISNSYITGSVIADCGPGGTVGKGYAGGLVGYNNNTNISNSYATASVMADGGGSSSGTGYAGGLVGYNNNTNISNSYATGPVSADSSGATANSYAGGLVGYTDNTIILNSYATGPVMSNGTSRTYAGGLIGQTYRNISVSDSYATGPVTATSDEISAGGLIGYSNVGNLIYNIIISDSYATGPVTATSDGTIFTCDISAGGLAGKTLGNTAISNSYAAGLILTTGIGSDISAGGLVGNIYSAASISNSYWDREASGLSVGCGNTSCSGATGKTTSAMITESTYSGWTFQPPVTDIWKLSVITPADRYYPCLSWQANATCVKAPLLIFTCEDLQKIGNDAAYPLNGNYILTNNIDCAKTDPSNSGNPSSIWDDAGSTYGTGGTGFEPIGWDSPFTGIFDGKGYQIQNLYINRPTNSFVGLFSYANSATIKNVGVIVDNILGGAYTGALLGICNAWCDIDSVYSISTSTGSVAVDNYWGGFVGGLAGEIRDTNLSNSYSTVPVTGTYVVGGLVGYNNNSSIISNSYFSGVVTGNNNSIGGLAGRNNGTIINSYAISNVSGVQYYEAGGLVGLFEGGTISKSYVVGAVSGATYKGGLVGTYYAGGVFSDSYWNTEVSGLSNICGSGSCAGATGKTTGQMILQSTYPTWTFLPAASANWKQSTLTPVANGYFPCLSWQNDNTCFCRQSLSSIAGKDTDGDGTEDRMDYCYENPAETAPRMCSCTDSFSPNSCCHPCDLTGDGVVNFSDITAFQNEIGKSACMSAKPWLDGYSLPSVPRNGFIDSFDYQGWMNRCYIQC